MGNTILEGLGNFKNPFSKVLTLSYFLISRFSLLLSAREDGKKITSKKSPL